MRTRFLLIVILLLSVFPKVLHAQFAVSDPVHTGITKSGWGVQIKNMATTIQSWSKQFRQMNEQLEISKRLQDIKNMKELESLMELADMIDQIQCISQEYSFHASLGKTYRCAKFLNVQGVVVNMRMSTDLLFKVASVADYFSMSSGERISMVKTVQECLSNATQTMESFNEISRNSIKADAVKSYYRDRYYGRMLNHKKLN